MVKRIETGAGVRSRGVWEPSSPSDGSAGRSPTGWLMPAPAWSSGCGVKGPRQIEGALWGEAARRACWEVMVWENGKEWGVVGCAGRDLEAGVGGGQAEGV